MFRARATRWILVALVAAGCGDRGGVPDSDLPADADQEVADADGERDGGADADEAPVDADEPPADADEAPVDADPERCPEGWSDEFDELDELTLGARFSFELPRCQSVERFVVLAAGVVAELTFDALPAGSHLTAEAVAGEELAEQYLAEGGPARIELRAPRSGDVRLRLRRPDGLEGGLVSGGLFCTEGCDLEATRYPIVLVHGMGGTDEYLGFLDYYYQVPSLLRDHGYAVDTPVTPLVGHSEVRAPILADQIDELLAETGAAKVHLIAHSQGGLDIRVLVSGLGYGDRVASMTTVASPHHGLRIELPEWLTGMNFNEAYMEGEFVADYPDDPAIPTFSWSGRSCGPFDTDCQDSCDGEVVITHLAPTLALVQEAHADDAYGGANDGLVPVASAIWGEHLGVLCADHYDEVGQIADEREGPFDHFDFYLSEARRLRVLELEAGL